MCPQNKKTMIEKQFSLDLNGMAAIEAEQTQKICIEKQFRSAHRLTDSTYRVNKCLTIKTTQWCETQCTNEWKRTKTTTTFALNSENLCLFPCQVNWHGTYRVQTPLTLAQRVASATFTLPATPSPSIRIIDLLSMVHLLRKFLGSKYEIQCCLWRKNKLIIFFCNNSNFLPQLHQKFILVNWKKKRWTQQNPVSLNKQKNSY